MKTDLPLKELTRLLGTDLLHLFKAEPGSKVVKVDSLDLAFIQRRLDNVVRIRSPGGQEYLHIVEWLGYKDDMVFWRMGTYQFIVGHQSNGMTVLLTLIYLDSSCDMGDTLEQVIDGRVVASWQVHCIRLWLLDAKQAMESGNLGLMILSLLMRNATKEMVVEIKDTILREVDPTKQDELLAIVGMFVEKIADPVWFMDMVGRERMLGTKFAEELKKHVATEFEAELEAQKQQYTMELQAQKQQYTMELQAQKQQYTMELQAKEQQIIEETVAGLQQVLERIIKTRFPQVPEAVVQNIGHIKEYAQLQTMVLAVSTAADAEECERLIVQATAMTS